MSAPALSNIDLSSVSNSPPPLTNIDLSGEAGSEPAGQINVTLSVGGSLTGNVLVDGYLDSSLVFIASLSGGSGNAGLVSSTLNISAATVGNVIPYFGQVSSSLDFFAGVTGYQDWLSVLDHTQLREIYSLVVTGAEDGLDEIALPISAWQATNQAGPRQRYLQATVPNGGQFLDDIKARSSGSMVLSKGYRLPDNSVRLEEIMRTTLDDIRQDRGPGAMTLTLSGYSPGDPPQSGIRSISGVRSLNLTQGKYRARCNIDLFLRPGMTVIAEGTEFPCDYINFYVSQSDKFCEVSQR